MARRGTTTRWIDHRRHPGVLGPDAARVYGRATGDPLRPAFGTGVQPAPGCGGTGPGPYAEVAGNAFYCDQGDFVAWDEQACSRSCASTSYFGSSRARGRVGPRSLRAGRLRRPPRPCTWSNRPTASPARGPPTSPTTGASTAATSTVRSRGCWVCVTRRASTDPRRARTATASTVCVRSRMGSRAARRRAPATRTTHRPSRSRRTPATPTTCPVAT